MSWKEDIENIILEIKTGDGKIYKPLWNEARKNINFNTQSFDFIGIDGSYVERKNKKGNKYELNFMFQGDDYLDIAKAFEKSSINQNSWQIVHPLYGKLTVQPISLEFDNSKLNIVSISGIFLDTIELSYPQSYVDLKEIVIQNRAEINLKNITVFKNKKEKTTLNGILKASIINDTTYKNYRILTLVSDDIKKLKDLVRKANASVQNIINDATYYIKQVLDLINFPFTIQQDIEFKIEKLVETYKDFKNVILNKDSDNSQNNILQAILTNVLSEMCGNAITPNSTSYQNRKEVYSIIKKINDTYADLISTFDALNYEMDANLLLLIDNIVNSTISSLNIIAFNSKQERIYILEKDDNIINLAHRFYGAGDDNLQIFIKRNNITLNEHFEIFKGRKIVYFV